MFFPRGGKGLAFQSQPQKPQMGSLLHYHRAQLGGPVFAQQSCKFFKQPGASLSHLYQGVLDTVPFTLEGTLSSRVC